MGRGAADPGRPWEVVDAAPPRGLRGGDLLRPRRVGRLGAVGRLERGRVRGRRRRLPRASGARARAHAAGRAGRPRGARVRRAELRGEHAPAARRCLVARAHLGARGRAGRSPVEAGRRPSAPPKVGDLSERPARIVNVGASGARAARGRDGRADRARPRAGSGVGKTGHRHFEVEPGKLLNPPHCHSAEEEIFVVLDGEGTLELWPHLRQGGELEEHPVRAGNVVARPAGTGRPHTFRAATAASPCSPTARATRRRHVLPSFGQGELPRRGPDRSSRRARLLGWGGLNDG